MDLREQLVLIKRVKALADTGLVYSEDDFNRERYNELREISLELLSLISDVPLQSWQEFLMPVKEYPTPKVDVRGFVLNKKNQILMARESADGNWAIPGGWADIGFTPTEMVVREIEEETGLTTAVERLLAIYDKKCHPHPPQPFYVYKLVFLCRIENGNIQHGFDMEGAAFFDVDSLPMISSDRILESQIEQLYKLAKEDHPVYFD
ncbi:NUDIX hydrolase [Arenibacter sp. F20364]|uniref:NUDIX hydrolase n=1 Tax=Arenibacter sp. F20364 TaxID=2926415 RepID=UPI001FF36981|nr:NUDIX hydrolase [Arenibacter sp. F20364]MCK0188705.1 NUDIX hydrolase [Arenibacter sp. F20364]